MILLVLTTAEPETAGLGEAAADDLSPPWRVATSMQEEESSFYT